MAILPRVDLSVRTVDLGLGSLALQLGVGSGVAAEVVVGPAFDVAVDVGLDRVLNSTSPVERLLNGPDALARFRASAVPADPSPIATRGMTVKVGDTAEVATRYTVGGPRPLELSLRGDPVARLAAPEVTARAAVGSDARGVAVVRDVAEAAALPQRVGGPGGTTATEPGINATLAGAALALDRSTGSAGSAVSLAGLVNIIDRPGMPIGSPLAAPVGAVLIYTRADGTTAVELRTAAGFAGAAATSTLPLTGGLLGLSGNGYTLVGVFVLPQAAGLAVTASAPHVDAVPMAVSTTASTPPATGPVAADATAKPAALHDVAPDIGRRDSDRTALPQPAYGTAIAVSTLAGEATHQLARPDGSTIPAGLIVAQEDARASMGQGDGAPDATDRPYVHSIWYDILALRFAEAGVPLLERSTALRDVVWATAIEHGPFANADATDVLSRVAAALDLSAANDATIIATLFAERARLTAEYDLAHFPEVLPFDRDRVRARLNDEAAIALARVVKP